MLPLTRRRFLSQLANDPDLDESRVHLIDLEVSYEVFCPQAHGVPTVTVGRLSTGNTLGPGYIYPAEEFHGIVAKIFARFARPLWIPDIANLVENSRFVWNRHLKAYQVYVPEKFRGVLAALV